LYLSFSEIKLSPGEVDRAFDNLKTFSGSSSDNHVLKEITWLQRKCFRSAAAFDNLNPLLFKYLNAFIYSSFTHLNHFMG